MAEGVAEITLFVGPKLPPGSGFYTHSKLEDFSGYREAIRRTFHEIERNYASREVHYMEEEAVELVFPFSV